MKQDPPKFLAERTYSLDSIRKEHPNAYRPWDDQEQAELINYHKFGKAPKEIASLLGRKMRILMAQIFAKA